MSVTTSFPANRSVAGGTDAGNSQDKPLPVSVCAAALVALSLGCWAVIFYIASLI